MRGQRGIFDTFPENVDLNQGPNPNSRGINESDECDTSLSRSERLLLSNELSGGSSSRANLQDQVANDGLNLEHNWSSPFGTHDSRIRERQLRDSFGGSQGGIGASNMQGSGSSHIPMDVDLKVGYGVNSSNDGGHGSGFMNPCKSGSSEMEASSSSTGKGTSSEYGTDSSFGNWGLSCKRKALEGTSGSSSCFPEAGNNGSSSVNAYSPTVNSREQINSITGVGMRGGTTSSVAFPSPSVPESSQRYYSTRDSSLFSVSPGGNLERCSNSSSFQSSRRFSHSDYLDQTSRRPIPTSAGSSHPSNLQPPMMHVPGMPRNGLPFPWSGNGNSRHGGSSSSELPRESDSEENFRITLRNNEQQRYFVPTNETRNLVQDPTNWSLASGRSSTSGANAASGSRNDTDPCSNPSSNAVWMPHLNSTTQGQQRGPEFSPWSLFPSSEAESAGDRSPFSPFPSGSSSTPEENVVSSGGNSQGRHHRRSLRSASLMEVPGDEWQAFIADIEGRHRLVSEMRQILNALRRGENLRAEDFMIFDPFINGVAELHDRHRDMRLDVDNMSYEELLALEERIGDVKTGVKEEVILKSLKQRKHTCLMGLEPCCICREEYAKGDDIGRLDCGHEFHTYCIKQWLIHKNVCPICKNTAIPLSLSKTT